jgi:hypothetical protein
MFKYRLIPILMAMILVLSGCGAKNETEDEADAATSLLFEAATLVTDVEGVIQSASAKTIEASAEHSDEAATSLSSEEIVIEVVEVSNESSSAEPEAKVEEDKASEAKSTEDKAAAETSTLVQGPAPQEPAPQPQVTDYGRILFVGDSRTVDMFDGGAEEIRRGVYNDITVYCRNACQLDYMVSAVQEYGFDNFDTLVSWMGCNDYGNFAKYEPFYDLVLANGKKLVLCTVGPTDDNSLDSEDIPNYLNAREIEYNAALNQWAAAHSIYVVDLYSYICSTDSVYIDPADGIHYQNQPTTVIWQKILSSIGR